MTLTSLQHQVLSAVYNHKREAPPTPSEVARYLWGRRPNFKPVADAESVNGILRRLERKGYVERLGMSASGGRCWAVTPEGQEALMDAYQADLRAGSTT